VASGEGGLLADFSDDVLASAEHMYAVTMPGATHHVCPLPLARDTVCGFGGARWGANLHAYWPVSRGWPAGAQLSMVAVYSAHSVGTADAVAGTDIYFISTVANIPFPNAPAGA